MSQPPQSPAPSQKRAQSTETSQPAKRAKTDSSAPSVDDILQDDFNFDLPAEMGDPLLNVPQFSQTGSSTEQNTPQQLDLELPELPDLPSETAPTPTQAPTSGLATAQSRTHLTLQFPSTSNAATPNPVTATASAADTPAPAPAPSQPMTPATNGNGIATPAPLQTTASNTSEQNNGNQQQNNGTDGSGKPSGPADPEKLSDALLAAGVDLKAEEALLASSRPGHLQEEHASRQPIIVNTPFLDPRQVAGFMNKIIAAHGMKPNSETDPALIQLMTYASEEWMKNILTNAIVLSRHRRRAIKNKRRSEVAVALRDIAVRNKTIEDGRAERKKNSGLTDENEREGVEETQHKATNATVAMMTGTKKKKYDWMSSGSGAIKNAMGEVSLRFREAREEPGLVARDLLNSLEKKRSGVEKTLAKGYAKMKD